MLRWLATGIAVGFIQLSLPPRKSGMRIPGNKSCLILELKPLPTLDFPGPEKGQPGDAGDGGTSPADGSRGEQGMRQTLTPPEPPPAVPRWSHSGRIPALESSRLLIPG